ncbi:hypothetical protein BJ138DRAFT_1011531 [Hygrophoropsis aurantiaca]|uniref:Uncharacterized protein n=1 Tax=Hygrophoropsis aurantiaca TaxID=72124 RepID=A0ACB8A8P9_9AGAM|nr:hypothetical protein BJ138DRAFT_1011531 [Hygrophoropsis aurantiaca]
MIAIDLGLRAIIASGLKDCQVVFRSDSQGVIGALKAGCSRNDAQNDILRRIEALNRKHNIRLSADWVSTKLNIADPPSRGVFPTSSPRFPFPPSIPRYLKRFVRLVR